MRSLSKDRADRQADVRKFYEELSSSGTGVGTATPQIAPAHPGATGTAAMPAANAPPAAQQGFSPVAHATPGGQAFPSPPAAPSREPKGGGKGLIIGLASLAGVLGLAAIVILAKQQRPIDDIPVTTPAATPTPVPTPVPPPSAAPIPPPDQPKADDKKDDGPEAPSKGAGGGSTTTPKKPTTGTPPPASSPSTPAPPPTPALSGDAACAEAKRLANNGDAGGAARVFQGCSGPNMDSAKSAITRAAPEAVKRRIFNGDCAGAKSILASLNAIGAGSGAQAVLDGAPQCKK